jgi:hypothetical protein
MPDALEDFLAGRTDPASFTHAEHVAKARRLLAGHPFLEAAMLYDRALAKITARAGAPEKRSLTKTLAFLSLIAEHDAPPSGRALETWYSPERLADPRGRDVFLMPDRTRCST